MPAYPTACQPRVLLLVSGNRAKIEELRGAAGDLPFRVVTAEEAGLQLPSVTEDGATFEENAGKKALTAAAAARSAGAALWTLADDSGLEVDALGGAPGVRSARFAGFHGRRAAQDRANIDLLLQRLQGVPPERRTARFVCVLAVADAHNVLATVRGTVAGRILTAPRGRGGFGYDPVFFHVPSAGTFAELEPAAKAAVSHRGRAVRLLRGVLARLAVAAVALGCCLALGPSVPVAASVDPDGPLVTDRPSFGDGPGLVPAGRVQIEGGATFTRAGRDESWTLGELLVRTGVAPHTEILVGINSYATTDGPGGDGIQDASLGFKLRLVQGGDPGSWKPLLALLGVTSLPTGSAAQGSDGLIPEARLAAGWSLGPRLSLGGNLNYAYVLDEEERFNRVAGGVSLGVSMGQRLAAYGELFSFVPASARDPNDHFVNAGLLYLVHDNVQVDVRAGRRLQGADPDWFVGVGAAWRSRP